MKRCSTSIIVREIQNNNEVRPHAVTRPSPKSLQMKKKKKKSTNDPRWGVWGKGSPVPLLAGCARVQARWGTASRAARRPGSPTPGHTYRGTTSRAATQPGSPTPGHTSGENTNLKRHKHPSAHSSAICSGQHVEATRTSISR